MTGRPEAAMLFAAGFGTRMGALTRDRPKPLLEVAGRPLIRHALDIARGAGLTRIVANSHYRAEMIEAYLAPLGVLVSRETPSILETGGGLRAALPLLGNGPVCALNTDAIWSGPNPLTLLLDAWEPARMDALLMCVAPEDAEGHPGAGDFAADAGGRITRGPGLIYGGAQILRTDGLAGIGATAFSLNLLWDAMIASGRAFGLRYPGRWCDVGSPEGLARAEAMMASDDV